MKIYLLLLLAVIAVLYVLFFIRILKNEKIQYDIRILWILNSIVLPIISPLIYFLTRNINNK